MDILNSYVIVDEGSGYVGAMILLVFPAAIGCAFFLANLLMASFGKTKQRLLTALVFVIIAIPSICGIIYCFNATPLFLRHEVLWRDKAQPLQIDPQKYTFVEQRGDIIILEQIEAICTRGTYSESIEQQYSTQ